MSMAGLSGPPFAYGVAKGKSIELLSTIGDDSFDDDDEVESVVKFRAIAKRLAINASQPLFTVFERASSS